MIKPVKSSRPGTLPCVRVISGAWGSPPAVAEVAVEAELAVQALPEAVVDLPQPPVLAPRAVLSQPEVVADLARLPLLAQLAVLVPLQVEAELVVEELLHRSFSSAMAGNLPSAGTPRYAPVPRSGRKAKRRPCPLA